MKVRKEKARKRSCECEKGRKKARQKSCESENERKKKSTKRKMTVSEQKQKTARENAAKSVSGKCFFIQTKQHKKHKNVLLISPQSPLPSS